MRRLLLWPAFVVCLAGCSDKDLVIESNTGWKGTVDQVGELSGRGSARYQLEGTRGRICWVFQKTTTSGVLRVYAEDKTWFGLGSEVDSDETTTEPSGQVRGCAQ